MQNRAMKKYASASAAISACARATSISCARFGPPQESLDEEFLPQRTQSVVRCACSSFVLANPPFIPLCQRGKEGDFPGRKGKRVRIRLFAPLRESLWFHCGAGAACVSGE